MKIETTQQGTVTQIAADGVLIDDNVSRLRAAIQSSLDAGDAKILLDLTAVPFIDSGGLEALLDLAVEAARRGGAIKTGALNETIRDIFVATRLNHSIELYSDQTTARRSFL